MKQTYIWVTFQKEGIHKYPAAKDIPGVEFLQYPHRHMFHFKIKIEVFHCDRDIEFILFKREMEQLISQTVGFLDYKSCEMICDDILQYLLTKYGEKRTMEITVAEDGENGATLEYKL